jgi:hypothetical protein
MINNRRNNEENLISVSDGAFNEKVHHNIQNIQHIKNQTISSELKPYNERKEKKQFDIDAFKNIDLPEIYELVESENINWSKKLKNFNYKMYESDTDDFKLVGYYGELWVYEMLKQKYEDKINRNQIELIWLNEDSEQGIPYDLKIIDKTDNTEQYIEVKSTVGDKKEHFSVSIQQLLFAENNQTSFFIYRLFNVNNGNPEKVECRIIKNVIDKMNTHAVKVFMII